MSNEGLPGWSYLRKKVNDHKILSGERQEFSEKEMLVCRVFSTREGRLVLKFLRDLTIERPSFVGGGSEGIATALNVAFLEGEKNIVRRIEAILRKNEQT